MCLPFDRTGARFIIDFIDYFQQIKWPPVSAFVNYSFNFDTKKKHNKIKVSAKKFQTIKMDLIARKNIAYVVLFTLIRIPNFYIG